MRLQYIIFKPKGLGKNDRCGEDVSVQLTIICKKSGSTLKGLSEQSQKKISEQCLVVKRKKNPC